MIEGSDIAVVQGRTGTTAERWLNLSQGARRTWRRNKDGFCRTASRRRFSLNRFLNGNLLKFKKVRGKGLEPLSLSAQDP